VILFPFLDLLAVLTSVVMIVVLLASGDLRPRSGGIVAVWFVTAVWVQFAAASAIVAAGGLGLQTLLAIYLVVKWRLLTDR
jgi:hypothetical protein